MTDSFQGYVVQLEHNPSTNSLNETSSDTYKIKDLYLTEEVEKLKNKLDSYNGIAGEADNINDVPLLTDDWFNSSPTNGLYLVKGLGSDQILNDNDFIDIYWNDATDMTHATNMVLPGFLLISDNNYTIIDANGIIWYRRNKTANDTVTYYWENLWDHKASIEEFRSLQGTINNQQSIITALQNQITSLNNSIEDLNIAQETSIDFAGLKYKATEDEMEIANLFSDKYNVLIIGDCSVFGPTATTTIPNLATKMQWKLLNDGYVTWVVSNTTKDSAGYFTSVNNNFPVLTYENGAVFFSSVHDVFDQPRWTLSSDKYDVVLILGNKNDIYNNSATGYIKNHLSTAAGSNILPGQQLTPVTINTVNYGSFTDAATIERPANGDIKKVNVTLPYNTYSAYLSYMIEQIQKNMPKAIICMASPITWEKNSTTDLTKDDLDNIDLLQTKIKNICQASGIKYYQTRQISPIQKSSFLNTEGCVVSDAAIENYAEDLYKIIMENLPSSRKYTITVNNEKLIRHTCTVSYSSNNQINGLSRNRQRNLIAETITCPKNVNTLKVTAIIKPKKNDTFNIIQPSVKMNIRRVTYTDGDTRITEATPSSFPILRNNDNETDYQFTYSNDSQTCTWVKEFSSGSTTFSGNYTNFHPSTRVDNTDVIEKYYILIDADTKFESTISPQANEEAILQKVISMEYEYAYLIEFI